MGATAAGALVPLLFGDGVDGALEQEQIAKEAIPAKSADVIKERLCDVIGEQDAITPQKVKKEKTT
ncbi:MAG TPA: hypothetical protein VGV18_11665 [Verrucomicrobiae bacterium]|nr:hypothetical protein [Verrucomicrobiae bacterium]